jgi:hypothetical protein
MKAGPANIPPEDLLVATSAQGVLAAFVLAPGSKQ